MTRDVIKDMKAHMDKTVEALRHAIRAAGRDPVQRDSYYHHLPPAKFAPPRAAHEAEGELVCA